LLEGVSAGGFLFLIKLDNLKQEISKEKYIEKDYSL